MIPVLDDDCWTLIFSFLSSDCDALFQSLFVSKALFRYAVRYLYRRPLIQFVGTIPTNRLKILERLLISQANLHHNRHQQDSPSLSPASLLTTSSVTHDLPQETDTLVDYYSFVQEMPDVPLCHPRISENNAHFHPHTDNTKYGHQEKAATRLEHLNIFGPKIRTMTLGTHELALMENGVPLLNNLIEFKFFLSGPLLENCVNGIQKAIRIHRKHFPNQLQNVSYTNARSGALGPCDVDLALAVRDGMDKDFYYGIGPGNIGRGGGKSGRLWGINTIKLYIPVEGQDEKPVGNLLTVLEDVDLPRQLKSVTIHPQGGKLIAEKWVEPLSRFLSRCRVLDLADIQGCPPEVFSWAVQQKDPKSLSSFQSLVQWKEVQILSHDLHHEAQATLWRNVVYGFGHCMEKFSFYGPTAILGHFHISHLETLSILCTDQLPNLRSLHVFCARFGGFSALATPRLQRLCFFISHDQKDRDEQDGPTRSSGIPLRMLPQSLKELKLYDRSAYLQDFRQLIGHLSLLETLKVYTNNQSTSRWEKVVDLESIEKAFDHRLFLDCSNTIVDSDNHSGNSGHSSHDGSTCTWGLPRLENVRLEGYSAKCLNLMILLLGRNIKELDLAPLNDTSPTNLSAFFDAAKSRSLIFPNLRYLEVARHVQMSPVDFGLLVGLPLTRNRSGANVASEDNTRDNYDMFPSLEQVSVGGVASGTEDDNLQGIWTIIQTSLRLSSCHGGGLERDTRLDLYDFEAAEKWEEWFMSDGVGFEATRNPRAGFSVGSHKLGHRVYQQKKMMGHASQFEQA